MPVRSATAIQISGTSTPSRSRVIIVGRVSLTGSVSLNRATRTEIGSFGVGARRNRFVRGRGQNEPKRSVVDPVDLERGPFRCRDGIVRPPEVDHGDDAVGGVEAA